MGSTGWLWLDIVICAVIFLGIVGVPLWLVSRRPDTGQEVADTAARLEATPMHEISKDEVAQSR
jgi:hypothetical protein